MHLIEREKKGKFGVQNYFDFNHLKYNTLYLIAKTKLIFKKIKTHNVLKNSYKNKDDHNFIFQWKKK